ncbi:unnamed protein product, partial [marine sediment metagenome]
YKFNVSDDAGPINMIFKYDDSGDFIDSFDLSEDSKSPVGVATVGGYIYVLDHPDHRVYKYDCCGAYLERSRILNYDGSSIANPKGLAIDIAANEMWVVSDTDKNIYQYSLSAAFADTGTPLPASPDAIPLDTNQQKVRGLAIDSSHLYVLDYSTSTPKETRFYQYRRSDGVLTAVSKVLLEKTPSNNKLQSPAGAMFDGVGGTWLWVVDSGTNKVYEYDITSLFDGVGSESPATNEFPLHGDNTDASGV